VSTGCAGSASLIVVTLSNAVIDSFFFRIFELDGNNNKLGDEPVGVLPLKQIS